MSRGNYFFKINISRLNDFFEIEKIQEETEISPPQPLNAVRYKLLIIRMKFQERTSWIVLVLSVEKGRDDSRRGLKIHSTFTIRQTSNLVTIATALRFFIGRESHIVYVTVRL